VWNKRQKTGLLSCAACGGSMFVHSHDHRRHRRFFYACMVYHLRGRAICKNNLESPMEATDEAVLDSIESDVLRVDVLETSLAKALEILQPTDSVLASRVDRLCAELARLDGEITRLAGAIATGGELSRLLAALQERERRRQQGRAELAAAERVTDRATFDTPKARSSASVVLSRTGRACSAPSRRPPARRCWRSWPDGSCLLHAATVMSGTTNSKAPRRWASYSRGSSFQRVW
jgi:recombinase-like zinc beta ribbon protein